MFKLANMPVCLGLKTYIHCDGLVTDDSMKFNLCIDKRQKQRIYKLCAEFDWK